MGVVDYSLWHAKIFFLHLEIIQIVLFLFLFINVLFFLCGFVTNFWQVTLVVSFLCSSHVGLYSLGDGEPAETPCVQQKMFFLP